MKKPKTMRGLLSLLLLVAENEMLTYKGWDKLSDDEEMALGECLAAIQNRLGDDLVPLLERYNLKWKG